MTLNDLTQKIKSFADLGENWDGYDGRPPREQCINDVIEFLNIIERDFLLPTFAAPSGDGSIECYWQDSETDLNVCFYGDGMYFYCETRLTPSLMGDDYEIKIAPDEKLRDFLSSRWLRPREPVYTNACAELYYGGAK